MAEFLHSQERLKATITLGESHFREFKSAYQGRPNDKTPIPFKELMTKLAEELVAFANADGGELLIGVEDDGTISGVPDKTTSPQNILDSMHEHIMPETPLPIVHRVVEEIEGKPVVLISVNKGLDIIYQTSSGKCLKRFDLEKRPISFQRLELSRREEKSRAYDSEYVIEAHVTDLDISLIAALAAHHGRGISPERYLQLLYLADYSNQGLRLRRSCILLFVKDILRWHSGSKVRFLKVNGDEVKTGSQYNVTYDKEIIGNIFELMEKGWEEFRSHLIKSRQLSDSKFKDQLTYPEEACIELLTNAIAHRDYTSNNAIEVYFFTDRLEVRSPGPLLSTISIESLNQKEGVHESRNPFIARVLRENNYMRELGEGVPRIFDSMRSMELKEPQFHSNHDFFYSTLPNTTLYTPEQINVLKMFDSFDLDEYQRRVIAMGHDGRMLSVNDIYEAVGKRDPELYQKTITPLINQEVLKSLMTNQQAKNKAGKKGDHRNVPRFRVKRD